MPPDLTAFEALFASHGARMKSFALNMLGNRADAEDAVQEAFLRAYRARHGFREGAGLSTWVMRILINACNDVGRRRVTRRRETALDGAAGVDAPARPTDHSLRIALDAAVAALAPIYRDVFLLFEVEGFTHREIADILAIPEGTSKARLFEARRQLRSVMGAPQELRHDA